MSFDDSPSLISPAMIAEAKNQMVVGPRPYGNSTVGLTDNGKVVWLKGLRKGLRDRVVKVTAEGWLNWFPVLPSDLEICAKTRAPKNEPNLLPEEPKEIRHFWG
jgi:hypothetical protein